MQPRLPPPANDVDVDEGDMMSGCCGCITFILAVIGTFTLLRWIF